MTVIEILGSDHPLEFATDPNGQPFCGSCPCASIIGDGFVVEIHCWRSSCEHGCAFAGVHVKGSIGDDEKRKLAEHIRDHNGWTHHTEWSVVVL